MLTGELPLGRFAPPSETQGVDPRLDNVVFRTLEKQVDERYQSAGEVQTQVETIAGSATPNADAAFSKATPEPSDNALKEDAALALSAFVDHGCELDFEAAVSLSAWRPEVRGGPVRLRIFQGDLSHSVSIYW